MVHTVTRRHRHAAAHPTFSTRRDTVASLWAHFGGAAGPVRIAFHTIAAPLRGATPPTSDARAAAALAAGIAVGVADAGAPDPTPVHAAPLPLPSSSTSTTSPAPADNGVAEPAPRRTTARPPRCTNRSIVSCVPLFVPRAGTVADPANSGAAAAPPAPTHAAAALPSPNSPPPASRTGGAGAARACRNFVRVPCRDANSDQSAVHASAVGGSPAARGRATTAPPSVALTGQ